MHARFRSPLARCLLLLLLAPHLGACHVTTHEPITPGVDPASMHGEITGITTIAGVEIPFEPAGARFSHDTLYASRASGPITIPTDSVSRLWLRKSSGGRTAALIGGLALGALVIAGAISYALWRVAPCTSGCAVRRAH